MKLNLTPEGEVGIGSGHLGADLRYCWGIIGGGRAKDKQCVQCDNVLDLVSVKGKGYLKKVSHNFI